MKLDSYVTFNDDVIVVDIDNGDSLLAKLHLYGPFATLQEDDRRRLAILLRTDLALFWDSRQQSES